MGKDSAGVTVERSEVSQDQVSGGGEDFENPDQPFDLESAFGVQEDARAQPSRKSGETSQDPGSGKPQGRKSRESDSHTSDSAADDELVEVEVEGFQKIRVPKSSKATLDAIVADAARKARNAEKVLRTQADEDKGSKAKGRKTEDDEEDSDEEEDDEADTSPRGAARAKAWEGKLHEAILESDGEGAHKLITQEIHRRVKAGVKAEIEAAMETLREQELAPIHQVLSSHVMPSALLRWAKEEISGLPAQLKEKLPDEEKVLEKAKALALKRDPEKRTVKREDLLNAAMELAFTDGGGDPEEDPDEEDETNTPVRDPKTGQFVKPKAGARPPYSTSQAPAGSGGRPGGRANPRNIHGDDFEGKF